MYEETSIFTIRQLVYWGEPFKNWLDLSIMKNTNTLSVRVGNSCLVIQTNDSTLFVYLVCGATIGYLIANAFE